MSSRAITAAYTHFLEFRIQYSSLALLYYDYALTFAKEVKYIWGSRLRLSTVLYVCCRYALLANVLYVLAASGELQSCNSWYKVIGAISVLGRAAVIVVFTLRAYAVFSRSRLILAYLGLLGAVCMALDIAHVPGLKCVGSSDNAIASGLLSILMVVFEFSSAVLTTLRSVQAIKSNGLPLKEQKRGFFYLILEQGVLYFCIMSIFTLTTVILNFLTTGFFQRLLNALTLPLSGLLTARFLLHLREWQENTDGSGPSNDRDSTTQELSEFEAVRRTMTSVADEFGEDPVVRPRNRHALSMELEMHARGNSEMAGSDGDLAIALDGGKREIV
ncbi:hypothetical protein NEOLEDRAFT_1141458 [Neolentinus lepideus HHB14362 ss-1]|uniref:DUF6533 domain-containing protein n=1 Tax=Neolentinus lepideus HHB14362 ss-1 TaxID=1314782 RepID=A0A165NMH3_9AGAM|nr:hypothetical protein NEOLEDRAFT_1141458 [Neolentinus lepideus HHB14362 ss-1]